VESVREEALARPVANDFAAREVVQRLFEKARGRRIQIRHLEVTMTDLREAPRQLSLFGDGWNGDTAAMPESRGARPLERLDGVQKTRTASPCNGKERRDSALTAALDRIRTRFGGEAVGFKRKT
jgi:hypothetical protein